jgi:hypothetical protein
MRDWRSTQFPLAGMAIALMILLSPLLSATRPARSVESAGNWRTPAEKELSSEEDWRSDSSTRYLSAHADFDGDGVGDLAELVVSDRQDLCAVRIRLSSRPGDAVIVAKERPKELVGAMGVDVLPPGSYATACGKGYFDCAPGEPISVTLRLPGLEYFRWASASSIFVWQRRSLQFERYWLSD